MRGDVSKRKKYLPDSLSGAIVFLHSFASTARLRTNRPFGKRARSGTRIRGALLQEETLKHLKKYQKNYSNLSIPGAVVFLHLRTSTARTRANGPLGPGANWTRFIAAFLGGETLNFREISVHTQIPPMTIDSCNCSFSISNPLRMYASRSTTRTRCKSDTCHCRISGW